MSPIFIISEGIEIPSHRVERLEWNVSITKQYRIAYDTETVPQEFTLYTTEGATFTNYLHTLTPSVYVMETAIYNGVSRSEPLLTSDLVNSLSDNSQEKLIEVLEVIVTRVASLAKLHEVRDELFQLIAGDSENTMVKSNAKKIRNKTRRLAEAYAEIEAFQEKKSESIIKDCGIAKARNLEFWTADVEDFYTNLVHNNNNVPVEDDMDEDALSDNDISEAIPSFFKNMSPEPDIQQIYGEGLSVTNHTVHNEHDEHDENDEVV